MTNLLPTEGKKRVLRDYWLRVASVYFLLLASGFLITASLLLPTYFYITFQNQALGTTITNEDTAKLKQIESDIKNANTVSKLLISTPEMINDSDIIAEIFAFSEGLVLIDSINIKKNNRIIVEILVNGTAFDRASLVRFRDNAEKHQFFNNVNLPLSNLAKDQNIPFSLTLEPSDVLTHGI